MPSARSRRILTQIATVALAGCSGGLFEPKGPIASAERSILYDSLGIMLAIVGPTILTTCIFVWWFRAANKRARYLPDWQYSGRIEMVVWSIPAMTILLLGGIGWIGAHQLDPRKPLAASGMPLRIQVVSLDWKWLFILPDEGIASVNRVVLPTARPWSFQFTSSSVMNSFLVPQLGSQVAVMPHMETQLYLQADQAGTYRGVSTQFSGDGFAGMGFTIEAVPPGEFALAIAARRGRGPDLDPDSFARLAQSSPLPTPNAFGSVSPGLFEKILCRATPIED